MDYDALLNTATQIGYMLLANGAEIYRVEESMNRVLHAYGVMDCGVFVVPSSIMVSVTTGQGHTVSKIKRVYTHATNLAKVERVNDLCRRTCRQTPCFAQVQEELQEIDRLPSFSYLLQLLAYALVAFSFTLFYGGQFLDACCALLCGASTKIIVTSMSRFHTNPFFIHLSASACIAIIALLTVHLGLALQADKIIIGGLMNLVPGIAITNCMRDIMAGDMFAGLTKLTESLLTATAIALGAGIALGIARALWGV